LPAVATYEQIVEANRATFAAWNAHDPDAVAAVFAPDAVIRDAIRQRAADMLVAFPDFRLRQLDLVGGENANADRWEVTATHSGPFLGMEATGNRVHALLAQLGGAS
jgi:predicted ester cyclase